LSGFTEPTEALLSAESERISIGLLGGADDSVMDGKRE
jgi:hypothetical protein